MNTTVLWPQVPRYAEASSGPRLIWPAGTRCTLGELPLLEWTPAPITPLPDAIELAPGEGWLMWDAAVASMDAAAQASATTAQHQRADQ
jgi:hypothetical protein